MESESGQQWYSTMIRDMPLGERPRERLQHYGASYLSNTELIAILLRSGTARENVLRLSERALVEHGGLGGIAKASYAELCEMHGISDAKACQILAALELGRRLSALAPETRAVVRSPVDVFNLLSVEMGLFVQEHLRALLLNTKNEVVAIREIYKGTVNSAAVRAAEVIRPAIRENCPNIIIVHNHPSGDPTPSPEDVRVTRELRACASMMDITLLDHIVIGRGRYVSLKQDGLGFDDGRVASIGGDIDMGMAAESR